MQPLDPGIAHELQAQIAEAVSRFGVAGHVRVTAERVFLEGHGPAVSVELGGLGAQWDQLNPDTRQRRATQLARELVNSRRGTSISPQPARQRLRLPNFVAPVLIIGAAAFAIYQVRAWMLPGGGTSNSAEPAGAPANTAATPDTERQARAQRVCEATRSRVMRGATVGPTDVEGWVVELTLLRPGDTPDLTFDPGLANFIERRPGQFEGHFAWAGAPKLKEARGPGARVQVSSANAPGASKPELRGVRLTFSGRYVSPYFKESERGQYFRTAAALAERLGASYGGLYARCAEGNTHHIGSWFRGPGAAGAAAALSYFMGAFAPAPHVRREVLFPDGGSDPRRSSAILRITASGSALTKDRVARLLGEHGGMIAGRSGGPMTLTFPFRDGNRASRASHTLARSVGVATER